MRRRERTTVGAVNSTIVRLRLALGMVATVFVVGMLGYWSFGLSPLDAAYQTITTVTTVGFRELAVFGTAEKWFTMVLIVLGVSTVLYTFTLAVQVVVEGQLREFVGRRRMDRELSKISGHTVVCGWGRVGRAVAADLERSGHPVVVVDIDIDRVADVLHPVVVGDATLDSTLRAAGLERASSLIAALEGDAENLFVTLSGRSINPNLFIVAAHARTKACRNWPMPAPIESSTPRSLVRRGWPHLSLAHTSLSSSTWSCMNVHSSSECRNSMCHRSRCWPAGH